MAKRITAKAFYEHIEADELEFKAGRERDEEAKRERKALRESVANVHVRMDLLATKGDIKEMKEAFETAKFGVAFFKVSWKTIGFVGFIILAIMGGWKALAIYFLHSST